MAFLGIGKKKKVVPDVLPDLISDELEKESNEQLNSFLKAEEEKKPKELVVEEDLSREKESKLVRDDKTNNFIVNRLVKSIEETPEREMNQNQNISKSFFGSLQENLSKLEDLEDWDEEKFASMDVLGDMKEYWKKKKKENVLDIIGQDFQIKINEKISKLQRIEKKWQSIYFDLIEVEEEIKTEEQELKDLLKEFSDICKHKKEIKKEKAKKIGGKNEKSRGVKAKQKKK